MEQVRRSLLRFKHNVLSNLVHSAGKFMTVWGLRGVANKTNNAIQSKNDFKARLFSFDMAITICFSL